MNRCLHALHRVTRSALSGLCAFVMLVGVFNSAAAQIITTVAGTTDIAGRPARSISVRPWGLATAPDGAVYVADSEHSQVLRFDPVAQTFTVVAGTTIGGVAGDGGPATSAQLAYPVGVAVDAAGNLFIADAGSGRIRKVSAATGEISTVAGDGWTTDDGVLATQAPLYGPWAVAFGPDGSLYIVEHDANRVRRIAPDTGRIYTVAGIGTSGSIGDDGPGNLAQLTLPSDVAVDAFGNVYIADQSNHRVRVVEAGTGIIRTFAGTGQQTWTTVDGLPALQTPLSSPSNLRFDVQGNLLVTEFDTGRIRKIEAGTTIVSTVGGGGSSLEGVPAVSGRIDMPQGLAVASNGDIYVSSQNNYLIQRIAAATGKLAVVAGNSWPNFSGDGGPALLAQMWPMASVVNANGDLFLIDNSRIRKVAAGTGMISTYAGDGPWGVVGDGGPAINAFLSSPNVLTIDASGNLFLSDQGAHRIRKINAATGIISHYAGAGYGYSGDGGPAVNAKMRQIRDMATDAAGNLYVIEDGSPRIRKIDAATGIITTIAGNGSTTGPWGDGLLATNVALYPLNSIALDAQANIYIVQQGRIRRIDSLSGIITTVAGNGTYEDTGDGGPALLAGIQAWDIKLDAAGNIFIASIFNHRVRRIDANTGTIATVVGVGVAGFAGDGGPAQSAMVNGPRDLAFNLAGDLYISEQFRVRRVAGIAAPPAGDTTPPVIVPVLTGTQPNSSGWYVSEVRISWNITDPESTVTNTSGCASVGVVSDGQFVAQCDATSAGGTATQTVAFNIDATPPTVAFGTPTPAPNTAGWNNTNVSIPYTMSDAMSGVYASSSQVSVSSEGANVQYALAVNDKAGNTRTVNTPALKIDKTPPTATVAMPLNGGIYGFGSIVTASYTCSDSLSSVSSCLGNVPTGSAIDTSTSGSKTFVITVTDLAGNVTTKTVNYTVGPPDTTPPNVSYNLSAPTTSAAGWHNTNVTVSWSLYDQESSITSSVGCTPTAVTTDTSGLTLTCTATSSGGTTTKSVTIKRDTVLPTIAYGTPTPAPNAAGWYNTDPSMPYTKSDDRSGIPGPATGAISMIGEGANVRYSIGFIDVAGNQGGGLTPAVNIDKSAPFANITSPSNGANYAVGSIVNAAYSCSDAYSGVATCVSAVPNGSAIDTTTSGTKTFSVTTTDVAGNVATYSRTYTVGTVTPPPPPPPPTPTYCSSRGSVSSYEWVRSLQAGSWTNTSNNNSGYGNFTANAPVSLTRGANSFVFTPGFMNGSSYVENWRVWVDLNQDGTFGSTELLYTGSSSGVLSGSVTIPTTALAGTTRMRVSMKWGSAPSPCEAFTYGEVEDYRVTIP